MEQGYLIDTNAIIDFCNGKLPENGKRLLLARKPEVSIITNVELFATKNISAEEYELLEKFTAISKIYPVTEDLKELVVRIRRDNRLKLPDAIIAATALAHHLILITRNTADFKNVRDLQVIDPHLL